jgi:hypothetical protein
MTKDERDQLRRTLEWVLEATQASPELEMTIRKAIDELCDEEPLGPEVV